MNHQGRQPLRAQVRTGQRNGARPLRRLLALPLFLMAFVLAAFTSLPAQDRGAMAVGPGAHYDARDPRPCTSRKAPGNGAPTAEFAKAIILCDNEGISHSSGGDLLYLITDLTVEVGSPRRFMMQTDAWPDIDPAQPVYPIRGGYSQWQCGGRDRISYLKGHNCSKDEQFKASGILYKDTFGDWHSKFMDPNPKNVYSAACPNGGFAPECGLPPPTGR